MSTSFFFSFWKKWKTPLKKDEDNKGQEGQTSSFNSLQFHKVALQNTI